MSASSKPNFFLRRPVLSAVISIVITLVGALAMNALPVAQYPELVPPMVTVSAYYPGASAETISSTVACAAGSEHTTAWKICST